jgi:PAS domain S-box-containing protein
MRSFDWSNSLLGPVEQWPESLCTSVSTCLNSRFAILIWWGPDLVMLYNDAYRQIIAEKHPGALGRPGRECWPEIWDIIGPMLEGVLQRGEATWSSDLLLMLARQGYPEECYFTFSYSPIYDESGKVSGVFTPVADTTERVINERRMGTLRDLAARASSARDIQSACAAIGEILSENLRSIPFASLYLFDESRSSANLVATAGIEAGSPAAQPVLRVSELPVSLKQAVLCSTLTVINDLGGMFGRLPPGAWTTPPNCGLVLPIVLPGQSISIGFVLAGANPHKRVEQSYRTFFELVAGHISVAIASAYAYQEERKRGEALAELDRAKTAFFSNVSHEFRTPLTLILGPLGDTLANRHGILPVSAAANIEIAYRNASRLLKLVNTLLEFSRIEAQRAQAFYQPINLAALTTDVASNFRSLCERAGLQLDVHCSLPDSEEPAYVDADMWEKIVLNLLSNAFKFTLQGKIEVRLHAKDGHAVLTVCDTGVGIAPEELPHIFERFHRVSGSRGRTQEGSGIGLALVQELVKLHGGSVSVESVLGQGSTFRVAIPLGKQHLDPDRIIQPRKVTLEPVTSVAFVEEAIRWLPDEAARDARLAYNPTLIESADDEQREEGRILWADDNADMRAYVSRLLGSRFNLEVVPNGQSALDAARARKPDLILADVMMPELDGFALLHEIRCDHQLSEIPFVLLSARAGEDARIEGLQAGADDYLTKPFSSRELLALVQSHVKLSRLRQATTEALTQADRDARLLASIIESSDDAIISKDLNGVITSWNKGAERLFGYTAAEAVGQSIVMLIPAERRDEEPRILASLRRGERVDHFETIRVRKDGSLLNISLTISPIRDAQGKIVGASKIARDITERLRQQSALKQANDDLRQFAYSASHDLQEPLRALTAYSQLLEQNFGGKLGDLGNECIHYIIDASQRMQNLLRDLRIYTQVSMAEHGPVEEIDSGEIVEKALQNLDMSINESGASITYADLPRVRMAAFELEQVFQNLIGNAIRYRGTTAPRIQIAARMQGKEWIFSVKDNGIGIAPEFHEQIFGIFKRLHNQSEYPGTGMGLAICQRSIQRYGGKIWVESEPEKGSTFFFTIPVVNPD